MRDLPRSTNSLPGAGQPSGDVAAARPAAPESAESTVNLADCSGSWYHAAAIRESQLSVTTDAS